MNDTDLLRRLEHLGDHLDREDIHRRQSEAPPDNQLGLVTKRSADTRTLRRVPPKVLTRVAVVVLGVGFGIGLLLVTIDDSRSDPVTDQPNVSVPTAPPPAVTFDGTDLDTSLPIVGRAWADTMEFSLSADANARLYNVWQAAIAQCMHARGFADYQAVEYPANAPFQDRVSPLDRAYAEVMGYHELPAEPVDPNPHTDATDAALQGTGGCVNVAFNATYDQMRDYTAQNDQLRAGLAAAISGFATSDVGMVVASGWSTCMSDHGRSFDSPIDAILAYVEKPRVTSQEIETRLIDFDCNVSVGYTQSQHDWEQTQIDTWRLDQNEAIQSAVTQRAYVEQQLIDIEIAVYGSNPD